MAMSQRMFGGFFSKRGTVSVPAQMVSLGTANSLTSQPQEMVRGAPVAAPAAAPVAEAVPSGDDSLRLKDFGGDTAQALLALNVLPEKQRGTSWLINDIAEE